MKISVNVNEWQGKKERRGKKGKGGQDKKEMLRLFFSLVLFLAVCVVPARKKELLMHLILSSQNSPKSRHNKTHCPLLIPQSKSTSEFSGPRRRQQSKDSGKEQRSKPKRNQKRLKRKNIPHIFFLFFLFFFLFYFTNTLLDSFTVIFVIIKTSSFLLSISMRKHSHYTHYLLSKYIYVLNK